MTDYRFTRTCVNSMSAVYFFGDEEICKLVLNYWCWDSTEYASVATPHSRPVYLYSCDNVVVITGSILASGALVSGISAYSYGKCRENHIGMYACRRCTRL